MWKIFTLEERTCSGNCHCGCSHCFPPRCRMCSAGCTLGRVLLAYLFEIIEQICCQVMEWVSNLTQNRIHTQNLNALNVTSSHFDRHNKCQVPLLYLLPKISHASISETYLLFERPPALAICGEVGENWKLSAFHLENYTILNFDLKWNIWRYFYKYLGSFSKSSQWFHLFSRALYTGTLKPF